jgi:hypothetical protein
MVDVPDLIFQENRWLRKVALQLPAVCIFTCTCRSEIFLPARREAAANGDAERSSHLGTGKIKTDAANRQNAG